MEQQKCAVANSRFCLPGARPVIRRNTLRYSALLGLICVTTFALFPLTGCNMYDPIIQEMETAYATATQKKGDTQEERQEAVTRAVQKYFPLGMKVEEAFKLLKQLRTQGFEIRENRLEGARIWPDGDLKPYRDEATRRNRLQIDPKGVMVNYTAEKKYERRIIFQKRAVISIQTDGMVIVSTEGTIIHEANVP